MKKLKEKLKNMDTFDWLELFPLTVGVLGIIIELIVIFWPALNP